MEGAGGDTLCGSLDELALPRAEANVASFDNLRTDGDISRAAVCGAFVSMEPGSWIEEADVRSKLNAISRSTGGSALCASVDDRVRPRALELEVAVTSPPPVADDVVDSVALRASTTPAYSVEILASTSKTLASEDVESCAEPSTAGGGATDADRGAISELGATGSIVRRSMSEI
jgi:hypothetical protein